jgi:hypothetical protein
MDERPRLAPLALANERLIWLDEQAAARDVQAFTSMMQEHGLRDGEG